MQRADVNTRALFVLATALLAACGGGAGGSAPSTPIASATPTTPPASNGPTASPTPGPGATASPTPGLSATASPSPTPAGPGAPTIGSCAVFPADNAWNADISAYAVDPNSANYMLEMNPSGTKLLHPDFGSNPTYGIPINVVTIAPANFTPIAFTLYPNDSDPGPYPIPANPAIEAPSDSHMLIVNNANCKLYEMWQAAQSNGRWTAANGAVFDLSSNALRPEGLTSADAAGLPIAAGLVRYAEVQAGAIRHALRFTMNTTFKGHIHPATHQAGTSKPWSPPMGLRLRLKANFNLSPFHGASLVILTALKTYGMLVADNGSDFYITGETNTNWNDTDLNQMKTVPAGAFEVVATGPVL